MSKTRYGGNSSTIKQDLEKNPFKWVDKDVWDFEKSFVGDTISWFDALKKYNMKQKVIVYNVNLDSSAFFSSYEDVAKHLDCKVDKLKRIADTEEKVNNGYLIRKCS